MDIFIEGLNLSQHIVLFVIVLVVFISCMYCLDLWVLTIISVFKRVRPIKMPNIYYWPKVSIHLPFYNEQGVAARIIKACLNFDYPKDQMEIIIIDDSDDGTTDIVREFQKCYSRIIRVLRRGTREGFKAGALQEALKVSKGEFIAIFDADYMPSKDFLKMTIPYLVGKKDIAFVQARWGYFDGDFSWFSKAFSFAADMYGKIDQTARYLKNLVPHFTGTCAVFRKSAVLSAGGWSADTMAEDLDLSIRLKLKGWKYIYLPNIEVLGEIPSNFKSLRQQQYRWAKGFTQCFKKHARSLLKCRSLSLLQKIESLVYLNTYTICPITIIGMAAGIFYVLLFPSNFYIDNLTKYGILILNAVMSSVIYTAPLAMAVATISKYNIGFLRKASKIWNLIYLAIFFYAMLDNYSQAVFSGFLGIKGEFQRTPKTGRLKPRLMN